MRSLYDVFESKRRIRVHWSRRWQSEFLKKRAKSMWQFFALIGLAISKLDVVRLFDVLLFYLYMVKLRELTETDQLCWQMEFGGLHSEVYCAKSDKSERHMLIKQLQCPSEVLDEQSELNRLSAAHKYVGLKGAIMRMDLCVSPARKHRVCSK